MRKQLRNVGRDPAVLDAALAADRQERDVERAKQSIELGELRSGRGRHVVARDRLLAAVTDGTAPEGLVARVRELDGLVAEADARIAALERDIAALEGQSDVEALKAALAEFDGVWTALDLAERARVLALVLDEVVVDGATGDAELRFRGAR